jgi:hypothetical protein
VLAPVSASAADDIIALMMDECTKMGLNGGGFASGLCAERPMGELR